ncbi:MAG: HNH endonuclease [Oscillospiraceae bacterium]|nr:HNH endonuclease [Oscillospiraceae bacterium]
MKGDFFNKEEVLDMLGGLDQEYVQNRKKIYRLKSGDIVVIRNNAHLSDYYWYNVQRDILYSDVKNVVCVAGYEGVYSIPVSIISKCAEEGHLSLEKDGVNYKLVLQRFSGEMCLRLTGSKEPIGIEQFQVYRPFYEKTNEIGIEQAASLSEGAKRTVVVNAYERNPAARKICIEHYGAKCQVCGFDFAATYGSDYEGLIEVHHIVPISSIQSEYTVDPIKDLIPLCPNCHTAIHKKVDNRCLTIEELRNSIASNRKNR